MIATRRGCGLTLQLILLAGALGASLRRPYRGGQPWVAEGRNEIRSRAGQPLFDLRHLVDQAGHRASHRRQGPHHTGADARAGESTKTAGWNHPKTLASPYDDLDLGRRLVLEPEHVAVAVLVRAATLLVKAVPTHLYRDRRSVV